MDHNQIKQEEIIERYVQQRLTADERLAFHEHYFACDECFDELQATTRFIAGVRDASSRGAMGATQVQAIDSHSSSSWLRWFNPLTAVSFATAILLAVVLVWLSFSKLPALQHEIASERQSRQESEKSLEAARNQADESKRQLEIERNERAKLREQVPAEPTTNSNPRPGQAVIAQADIPSVTLESTRDSQSSEHQLEIPAGAKNSVLLIPVEPGNRFQSFRVQLLTAGGQLVGTFNKARPNRHGAVTVSVPTVRFQSQKYLVRIYGLQNGEPQLLGEYDLLIRKQ